MKKRRRTQCTSTSPCMRVYVSLVEEDATPRLRPLALLILFREKEAGTTTTNTSCPTISLTTLWMIPRRLS